MSGAWVEILDSHGRVRERHRVPLAEGSGAFTIGRSAAAELVLDDPYVAPFHARIDISADGTVRASDLDSINGLDAGAGRVHGAKALELTGGLLTVGRTRLRIRTGAEALAPERRDNGEERDTDRRSLRWAVAGGAVCALVAAHSGWVNAPQDVAATIAYSLISWTVGALGWVAAWAFLSRVIVGEWRWLRHAGTLLGVLGVLILIDMAFDITWFALSLPYLPALETLMLAITVGLLLYWHLTRASHVSARAALVASILLPVVVAGTFHLLASRNQARDVNYIAMDTRLFPPAFRLRPAGDLGQYFNDAARLKAEADSRRRQLPSEGGEEDDIGDF
jgi:hypothetical protein